MIAQIILFLLLLGGVLLGRYSGYKDGERDGFHNGYAMCKELVESGAKERERDKRIWGEE